MNLAEVSITTGSMQTNSLTNRSEALQIRVDSYPEHCETAGCQRATCGTPTNSLKTQTDRSVVDDADVRVSRIHSKVSLPVFARQLQNDRGDDEQRFDLDVFFGSAVDWILPPSATHAAHHV